MAATDNTCRIHQLCYVPLKTRAQIYLHGIMKSVLKFGVLCLDLGSRSLSRMD